MARFLFAVWPVHGKVFPHLAVALALRARGHDVAFYTGASVGELLEGEKIPRFPLARSIEARREQLQDRPEAGSTLGGRLWLRFSALHSFFASTLPDQVADLDRIVAAWHPDVIAGDPSVWAPFLVYHEARGIPVALLSPYAACMLPGADSPPFGFGLPRPRDLRTRLLSRGANALMRIARIPHMRQVNALRREHGLPPIRDSVVAQMGRMPLYVLPSSREFDLRREDPPESVHYVGPCPWYPPNWGSEGIDELSLGRPVIHVSEGMLPRRDPLILRAAVQGLSHQPMQVILSTGGQDPESLGLGELAPNLRACRWVSYPDLLPRADVVVTAGGSGTVLAALAHGVPLVVVPATWDQPENARRVVEAGAGVVLSRRRCSAERLRRAVEHVLHTPSYREAADRLRVSLGGLGGAARAAELLEALVTAPAPMNR